MTEREYLDLIRPEINAYRIGVEIANAYGCDPSYVSQVLHGKAQYNSKLIEVATNILKQYKQKSKKSEQQRARMAKELGF